MAIKQKIKDTTNVGIGASAGYGTFYFGKKLLRKPINKFYQKKLITDIPQSENSKFMSAAEQAYEKSNLKSKGIKIVHVTPENYPLTAEAMKKKEQKTFDWFDKKMDKMNRKALREISLGKNAGYIESSSGVYVNKDKMGIAVFHELGHGINWKSGGLRAFNAGFGNIAKLAIPLIFVTGLLKNKKKDDEKTKGFWDKTTTFIKNNCAGISAGLLLPTLIDEGLASYNGAKIAKKVLNKQMLNRLNQFNALAYSSYVLGAVFTYCFVKAGIKLRDKIVDYKPIK